MFGTSSGTPQDLACQAIAELSPSVRKRHCPGTGVDLVERYGWRCTRSPGGTFTGTSAGRGSMEASGMGAPQARRSPRSPIASCQDPGPSFIDTRLPGVTDSRLTHRGGPGRGRGPRAAGHRTHAARRVAEPPPRCPALLFGPLFHPRARHRAGRVRPGACRGRVLLLPRVKPASRLGSCSSGPGDDAVRAPPAARGRSSDQGRRAGWRPGNRGDAQN
jgi:hypothetical protein